MKSTDLMIGDWVLFCGSKYHITNADFTANYEFEPIPLTKEILEKNGFEGGVYLWINAGDEKTLEYYPFEYRLILWYGEGKSQEILFKCQCFYVHEFQHALKLCGIEKEIVV